jgi:hypothetical protein
MNRRLIAVLLLSAAVPLMALNSSAHAQAGSTGGTIGKQDKSISGGGETTEERPRHPSAKPAVSRNREPRERAAPRTRFSMTGHWHWDAKCEKGNFTGLFEIVQTADTFTLEFGHTNIYDNGTVTNGEVHGNVVTFDREYFGHDHVRLILTSSPQGMIMQGPHLNAAFGHCQLFAHKD